MDVTIGEHARIRMLERGIAEEHIQQVITDPERVEQGRDAMRVSYRTVGSDR